MPTYRCAVIGRTGKGNYGHALDKVWFELPNCKLVAVADDNKLGLRAEAKRLKLDEKAAYLDYRKMLDEVKPDVVSICNRWIDQHADMVIECAKRGIHIYLEKPMCQTLEQADAMVAAVEKNNVKLTMAHQTRYSPKLPVVKQLIDDGVIGQVLEYRGRGKEDHRGGGEDLWVLGTHVFNLINYFGGDPLWCMANVMQGGEPVAKKHVGKAPGPEGIGPLAGDHLRAIYGMADGATASFASRRRAAGKPSRFGLQIYGSKGIIEILTGHLPSVKLLEDSSWSPGRSGKKWIDVSTAGPGKPETVKDGSLPAGNVLAVKDLLDAIENDRQPEGSIYEARTATEMIIAVFESHRLNGPATFPLKNRKNPLTLLA